MGSTYGGLLEGINPRLINKLDTNPCVYKILFNYVWSCVTHDVLPV